MNESSIKIEEGRITIRPAADGVWLTQYEIAGLFSVLVSSVGGNIRSILKTGILREENVCRHQKAKNGGMVVEYNLEMITALAFRFKSRPAQQFRRWIVRQALNPGALWKIPGMDVMLN